MPRAKKSPTTAAPTFDEIKKTIVDRAKKLKACSGEYKRAANAVDEPALVQVIKDNFRWCKVNELFTKVELSSWFDCSKYHIFIDIKDAVVSLSGKDRAVIILWGSSQATVKTWGSSQATVETLDSSQATVETLGGKLDYSVDQNGLIRDLDKRQIFHSPSLSFQIVTLKPIETDKEVNDAKNV